MLALELERGAGEVEAGAKEEGSGGTGGGGSSEVTPLRLVVEAGAEVLPQPQGRFSEHERARGLLLTLLELEGAQGVD